MTVFKTFIKLVKAYKAPIIMYTVMLIFFGGMNAKIGDNNVTFTSVKPDILIINKDTNEGITKSLIDYLSANSTIVDVKDDDNAIKDALFYRDISYIIYIPNNFRNDFLNDLNPTIEVEGIGDYETTLASMMLNKYINIATRYLKISMTEEEIIKNTNQTISLSTPVAVTSKLDTDALTGISRFYNFSNYTIIAACVYVICLILSSFKNESIRKRTVISSMPNGKYNFKLLVSSSLFAFIFWIFYVLLSFIIIGKPMFSIQGLYCIINAFVFTFFALNLGLFLGNLIVDKNALNGIINVVALGSSFLCGAFVPTDWLPKFVLDIAHILPSYYYINSTERIIKIEEFNLTTLTPVLINTGIMILFSIVFIILTNYVSKKKRKLN